ncbi:MAG: putative Ig domain-containing protein [Oceanipulchritudo sp.]
MPHARSLLGCLLIALWTMSVAEAAVLVNQSGYNVDRPKRFTAPLAADGTVFTVTREGQAEVLFSGELSNGAGDFSGFQPSDNPGPYVVHVTGEGTSFPFGIGDAWMERVSYQRAIDFMVDSRRNHGFIPEPPADGSIENPPLESSSLGIAWRDSHQFSFELSSLISMYCANPSAFTAGRMRVQGTYENLRQELPAGTPEIVQLIYWGVDLYLRSEVNHTLLKEQLAWFLYFYPAYSEYIPYSVYEEVRDYLFPIWDQPARDRFNWYDIGHSANLLEVFTVIGSGKGSFPPGHSVLPNLMMYEIALSEGMPDPEQYFHAAYNQAEWLINNLDLTDPATTKGQRMSEHVLMEGLAVFRMLYPDRAPAGLMAMIEQWADIMIARSDNMWDFRKYSDTVWTIPSYNEPGNVAGFPGSAFPVRLVLDDAARRQALERIAIAQIDNMFGRNPLNRHFSYDAADPESGFEGVERGWSTYYAGGVGQLQDARGVLDGSPKDSAYPYDPNDGPGYTEGWVAFNAAWNAALAWTAADAARIRIMDTDSGGELPGVVPGMACRIELIAPLNFDYTRKEEAVVRVFTDTDAVEVVVRETARNSGVFRGEFRILGSGESTGQCITVEGSENVTAAYGWGFLGTATSLPVDSTALTITTPSIPAAALSEAYSPFVLQVANAAGPLQWTLVDGSLPPGVLLAPAGEIAGTPSEAGAFTFTLQAEDGTGTDEHVYSLSVDTSDSHPRIRTGHLPAVSSGEPYAAQLHAVDGNGPAKWSLVSGLLPAGLTLGENGLISGRTTDPGWHAFTVRAEDSDRDADQRQLALVVLETGTALILDSEDPEGITVTGSWAVSSFDSGYAGDGYLHDQNSGKGSKQVRFTSDLGGALAADVYLRWTAASNRATNTPVDIVHASGTTTLILDQQENGSVWNYLGRWDFSAAAEVIIRNDGTNGYVIADAVRFVPAEPSRYRLFQERFFPGGAADPQAARSSDPDSDGRTNLREYADHTHPLSPANEWVADRITRKDGTFHYTFAFDDNLGDTRTVVEYSTDLDIWSPLFDSEQDRTKSASKLAAEVASPEAERVFFRRQVMLPAQHLPEAGRDYAQIAR